MWQDLLKLLDKCNWFIDLFELQCAIFQEQVRVRVDRKNVGINKAVLSRIDS